MLLLKPWTALKIWKLGYTSILSVQPKSLQRCVASHCERGSSLQRGTWGNAGGRGTDQGEVPTGVRTDSSWRALWVLLAPPSTGA